MWFSKIVQSFTVYDGNNNSKFLCIQTVEMQLSEPSWRQDIISVCLSKVFRLSCAKWKKNNKASLFRVCLVIRFCFTLRSTCVLYTAWISSFIRSAWYIRLSFRFSMNRRISMHAQSDIDARIVWYRCTWEVWYRLRATSNIRPC